MDYLVWRVWIGLWIAVICTVVVALEGCFLVKHFTRFTEEIFAGLISFIFVYEALKFLYEVRNIMKYSSFELFLIISLLKTLMKSISLIHVKL